MLLPVLGRLVMTGAVVAAVGRAVDDQRGDVVVCKVTTGAPAVDGSGKWFHVAGWYDGINVSVAVDGAVRGSQQQLDALALALFSDESDAN